MLHHNKNITIALALFCAVNGEFLDYSGREGHFYQNEIYFHRLSVSDRGAPIPIPIPTNSKNWWTWSDLGIGIGRNWSDLVERGSRIGRTWNWNWLELVGLGRARFWNWSELVEIVLSYFALKQPRIKMKLARGIVT